MDIDPRAGRLGRDIGLAGSRHHSRANQHHHFIWRELCLPLFVVALVFQPAASRLVAYRGCLLVGIGAVLMCRAAAIFGAGKLADSALFRLGEFCCDPEPQYRAPQQTVRTAEIEKSLRPRSNAMNTRMQLEPSR